MPKIEFERFGDSAPYKWHVIIDGERRAMFFPSIGRGYYIYTLDMEMLRRDYSPMMAETKAEFEATVLLALELQLIPDAAGYERRKAERKAKFQSKIVAWKAAKLRERYADLGPELHNALKKATEIAEEARQEWDAAPQGMRAGKLLIALGGFLIGYRGDIDLIHRALARADEPPPEPDADTLEDFRYEIIREGKGYDEEMLP